MLFAMQLVGSGLLLLIAIWPHWPGMRQIGNSGLDGTVLAVGTCLIMFSTVLLRRRGGRWTSPIRWFGRHSYEVYLTHEFIVVWATVVYAKLRIGPLPVWYAAVTVFSAALGALVGHYFAEPMNRRLRGTGVSSTPADKQNA